MDLPTEAPSCHVCGCAMTPSCRAKLYFCSAACCNKYEAPTAPPDAGEMLRCDTNFWVAKKPADEELHEKTD